MVVPRMCCINHATPTNVPRPIRTKFIKRLSRVPLRYASPMKLLFPVYVPTERIRPKEPLIYESFDYSQYVVILFAYQVLSDFCIFFKLNFYDKVLAVIIFVIASQLVKLYRHLKKMKLTKVIQFYFHKYFKQISSQIHHYGLSNLNLSLYNSIENRIGSLDSWIQLQNLSQKESLAYRCLLLDKSPSNCSPLYSLLGFWHIAPASHFA